VQEVHWGWATWERWHSAFCLRAVSFGSEGGALTACSQQILEWGRTFGKGDLLQRKHGLHSLKQHLVCTAPCWLLLPRREGSQWLPRLVLGV
jgi:hypothetical protein